MTIQRPQIGEKETYRGYGITVQYLGPDLMALVDGRELSAFYLTAEAARKGARRFIDQLEEEKKTK